MGRRLKVGVLGQAPDDQVDDPGADATLRPRQPQGGTRRRRTAGRGPGGHLVGPGGGPLVDGVAANAVEGHLPGRRHPSPSEPATDPGGPRPTDRPPRGRPARRDVARCRRTPWRSPGPAPTGSPRPLARTAAGWPSPMPGSRPGHWRRPTSGGSCERSRAARRRGTGRSPRCSSTPGYASPSWPPSRWAICRSRPAGVGCGFARGRVTPTREVPLNSVCRHAIDEWTTARTDQVAAGAATSSPPAASAALWLSRSESRISARVIDSIIRRLAKDAHLELSLSAHTLRHTAVTNLILLYSGSGNPGLE